jgi:hypothetical protein
MSGRSAAATEMIDRVAGDTCGNKWEDSPGLGLAGVYTEFRDDKPGDLDYVVALDPRLDRPDVAGELPLIGTPEGIYPGSPLTDLRSAYGDRLHRGEFAGTGEPFTGYVLFDGGGALVFQMHGDDATRVESIMATRGTDMDNLVIPVGGC